jgi:glutaredoxin-like protein
MAILPDQVRQQLADRFRSELVEPVVLTLYIRPGTGRLILPTGMGCATCDDARALAEGVAETAPDLISLRVVDLSQDDVDGVADVPTLTVSRADEDARIRWQGLPAGYEFSSVVDGIERVSSGKHGLSDATVEQLGGLTEPVEVMVFSTTSCPHCPKAISLANRMALASPQVRAMAVEANEFPSLAAQFGVQGVPRTVVNRTGAFVGALPEAAFVDSVLRLAGVQPPAQA